MKNQPKGGEKYRALQRNVVYAGNDIKQPACQRLENLIWILTKIKDKEEIMRRFCLLMVIISFAFLSACAFGKFGSADLSYTDIKTPAGITPKVSCKVDILNLLGTPNTVTKQGTKETWVYNNQCGIFIILYGKTISKDLVINFTGDKVVSCRLVPKGESTGIFAYQGAVAK